MSKLTSVEWLRDKIFQEFRFTFSDNILDEAKEMHKQEMGDTWDCAIFRNAQRGYNATRTFEDFDDYYNEIYQSVDTNEMVDVPQQNDVRKELSERVKNESFDVREDDVEKLDFEKELESLINKHSIENESDTPDFVLSSFLYSCLQSFKYAVKKRELLKAKENTYTEEQVREAIEIAYMFGQAGHFVGEGESCTKEIIQSLKQNK